MLRCPHQSITACLTCAELNKLRSPAMTLSRTAASLTLPATGPTTSSEDAYAIRPYRETRPYVGLTPTTPQKCAGCLMLPPAMQGACLL